MNGFNMITKEMAKKFISELMIEVLGGNKPNNHGPITSCTLLANEGLQVEWTHGLDKRTTIFLPQFWQVARAYETEIILMRIGQEPTMSGNPLTDVNMYTLRKQA